MTERKSCKVQSRAQTGKKSWKEFILDGGRPAWPVWAEVLCFHPDTNLLLCNQSSPVNHCDYNIVQYYNTDQNRDGKNCTAKTLLRPRGSWSGSWLSRVGEGSPTLCQTCTTALQALVRVVYLVLMLRLLRGGVRGRWCGFKRNPPSCWAFGCQTAKPLSNERPNHPPSPATDSQN